jgi:predicted secreted protein
MDEKEKVEIDPSKLSSEVTAKYILTNNALKMDKVINAEKDLYTNDRKDEINVIVGDDKQPNTFLPQVKLERWTNEVNFSVRLKDEDTKNVATVTTDRDKVVWDKGNIKIESYDYTEDGSGYKLVWYIKSKPLSNRVEFTIQSKGLDFLYQPPMTEEILQEGQTADEGHIYDSEGKTIAERPENVIGSYAVYHSTKGGMSDKDGKEYKTGKAFHIYRPHLYDSSGKQE